MEELILYGLLNYHNYVEFGSLLDDKSLQESSPKSYEILQTIRHLFSNQPAPSDLSVSEVEIAFYTYRNALPLKEQTAFKAVFNKLRAVKGVDPAALKRLLQALQVTNAIREAMMIANEVINGRKQPSYFFSFVDSILRVDDSVESICTDFLDMSLGAAIAKYNSSGLKWKLKTLRAMFGSLRQGDFGFIFARPDVGKTTLITDQCSYMSTQSDGMLIHFNNEEAGDKIKNRYHQSVLGVSTKMLMSDYEFYEKEFQSKTQGKIQIVDEAHMHRKRIEAVCQRHNPKLIVLDSIDKIWGFGESGLRDDLHYKAIYQWARELAKEYGPVIGSCHASAEGANTKWLTMEDVAYAKTAKQGEADWILGIGHSSKLEDKNIRYLSACKNKQMGDDETIEKYRHGKLPVRVNTEIGQYSDYMEFADE
jgi:hypothetical protein